MAALCESTFAPYKNSFHNPKQKTMKANLILIISAVVIFASCSKTEQSIPGNALKNSTELRQASPITGTMVYHATTDFDLGCDCAPYFPTDNYFATGTLTHLGLTTSKAK